MKNPLKEPSETISLATQAQSKTGFGHDLSTEQQVAFAKLYAAYPVKGSQADATEAQAVFAKLLTEFPHLEEQMDATVQNVKQNPGKFAEPLSQVLANTLEGQRASRSREHADGG